MGYRTEGMQKRGIQERRRAVKEECRKVRMQERMYSVYRKV